jgi:hypothetical protein
MNQRKLAREIDSEIDLAPGLGGCRPKNPCGGIWGAAAPQLGGVWGTGAPQKEAGGLGGGSPPPGPLYRVGPLPW